MNRTIILITAAIALASCSKQETMPGLTDRVFALAERQLTAMDARLGAEELPRTISADGEFVPSNVKWWCSGFYPGSLWYVYEYTGSEAVKALAEKNTAKISPIKWVTNDHDVGFQLNCSFGNGYRLTGREDYADVMYTGAKSLATRFNPAVGCIRSWDFVRKGRDWKYPVIIDNMMNLELLMKMADKFGDDSLSMVARSHADTTLEYHFRSDHSSFHLVDYDPQTGVVRSRQTVQGFADGSAWARGQAWGLYGYTMMYRLSADPRYLRQAHAIADMLIPRLPADGIPYWDFDSDKIPDDYRDASAGAIIASALVELAGFTDNAVAAKTYMATAEQQLRTLASPEYLAAEGENCNFLLKHSVGSLPDNSEVDVPLTYADYYFLEALMRYAAASK